MLKQAFELRQLPVGLKALLPRVNCNPGPIKQPVLGVVPRHLTTSLPVKTCETFRLLLSLAEPKTSLHCGSCLLPRDQQTCQSHKAYVRAEPSAR